jgi:hypothetical protein
MARWPLGLKSRFSSSKLCQPRLAAAVLFDACRFASESFLTGASSTQLSTKLLSLLQDCICTHLFPELTKRLERLKYAVTPAARTLLKKGRRYVC